MWMLALRAALLAETMPSQNWSVRPSREAFRAAYKMCWTRTKDPLASSAAQALARLSPTSLQVLRMSDKESQRMGSTLLVGDGRNWAAYAHIRRINTANSTSATDRGSLLIHHFRKRIRKAGPWKLC